LIFSVRKIENGEPGEKNGEPKKKKKGERKKGEKRDLRRKRRTFGEPQPDLGPLLFFVAGLL